MKPEYLEYTDQDYQNIAQCFQESRCDGTAARLLYTSRYGVEISAEDVKHAIDLYGDAQTLWRDVTHPNPEESIKNEIIDPEEEAVIENENVMYVVNGVSDKIPIVYTTKLDDMLIFQKDFRHLDKDDIVENIIIESKVKFKKLPVKTENILKNKINPFFKLVENIRQFNELTNTTTCDDVNVEESTAINKLCLNKKSLMLLKKCRPLSVVLVDYRKEGAQTSLVPKVTSTITTKEFIKLKKSEYNSLIFLNNLLNSTEIYYLNDHLIASHFINLGHVHYSNYPLNSIIMENCCWVARENYINNLNGWSKNHVGKKTAAIMKIPHQCPLGKCSCCCKNRLKALENNFSDIKAKQGNLSTDQIDKSDTTIWLKNLLSISSNEEENNIINKALGYKKSKSMSNKNKILYQSKQASQHVRLNNLHKNTIEIFSGGHQSVIYYIEVNNADETIVLPRLVDTLSITNRKDVCCWCARDKLLCSQRSHYSQSEINMMRTPHTCPVDDCKCCCKTLTAETTTTYGPKDCSLVKNLIFAKKYTNKTFQRRKKLLNIKGNKYSDNSFHSFNQKHGIERNYSIGYQHVNTMVKTHAYLNKAPTSTALIPPELPAITSPFISKTTNIPRLPQMLVVPLRTYTPPSTSNHMVAQMPVSSVPSTVQLPTSMQPQQNPTISIDNCRIPGTVQPDNDDPAVNSFVQSILGRFSDVRLIATPEGEVSVELNEPMENLSTAELKILSAILAHAKEQVIALKSNPGVPNTMINLGSIPGMSVTSLPHAVVPTAPAVTAIPGIPCTPVIESVVSKAPVTSIVSGTSGTNFISIAPKSPFASGIASMSPTPVINSATLQIRPAPKFLNNSLPRDSLNSSIPSTNSTVSNDVINKTVPSRTNVYQCYTNITALKSKEYILSCQNFMKSQINVVTPKIDSVYSLTDHNIFDEAPQAAVPTATAIDPAIPGPSGIKRKVQGVHADDVANSKKHRPIILSQQSCETKRGMLLVLPNLVPFTQPQVPVVVPAEEQSSPSTKVDEECILGF